MKLTRFLILLGTVALSAITSVVDAAPGTTGTTGANSVSRLPVKEVTVFKDGHAFVVHEGALPTNESGSVVLDSLPAPVIGTFWAYSTDETAKVSRVVAGPRRRVIERTALTISEMIEGNPGAEVEVTETDGTKYPATLIGQPVRLPEEPAVTNVPDSPEPAVTKSPLVMLKTPAGIKVMPLARIQDLVFRHQPNAKTGRSELENALTLQLDWKGQTPTPSAQVGLMYLQKGIRWIPSYKIDLDGKGMARVRLQATVLNELTDLDETTLQLVIGVPTFHFKDTVDPIALQQTAAQLSQFFQSDPARGLASHLSNNFSNSIMTQQVGRAGELSQASATAEPNPAGDPSEEGKQEDLYVFTVPKVSLKTGERLVLPLLDITVPYDDVYTLHLPFTPSGTMRQQFGNQSQEEQARLSLSPKVTHKARLKNNSQVPFTTAPALVLRDGRVLAQGLMTYAAANAAADVTITSALDITVKKTDREITRTPNALSFNNSAFMRVDLEGRITLTNHKSTPVEIEVTRHALGHVDTADHDGVVEMSNVFESGNAATEDGLAGWWRLYNWPSWSNHINGVGRITWKVKLAPGEPVDLGYGWHYFWN
jgi:hypothetical protein